MPTERVRIVPRYEKRGDIALGLFLGLLCGAIVGGATPYIIDAVGVWNTPIRFIAPAVVVVVPPVLVLLLIPYFTDAERPLKSVFIAFTLAWVGAFIGAWNLLSPYSSGDEIAMSPFFGALSSLSSTLCALVLLFPALAWRKFIHRAVVRPLPQDGDHCWKCAYQLGSERIDRCPECGQPRDANRFQWGWLYAGIASIQSRAWTLLAVLVVILGSIAGFIIWDRALPMARLHEAIARQRRLGYLGALNTSDEHRLSGRGITVFLNDRGSSSTRIDIVIRYAPHRLDGGPVLQLRTAQVIFTGPYAESIPTDPPVHCDLNREQAEFVLDRAFPDALIDGLVSQCGPQPFPPAWPLTGTAKPPIIIDPQPFIDALRRTSQ